MKWVQAHKILSVILGIAALSILRRVWWYSVNDWSALLGAAGLVIPLIQIARRNKQVKWLGRFAPVLSMGLCGLSIWLQLHYYLENIENLPRADVITARGVWIAAIFLLTVTVFLNLMLAVAERDIDTKLEEDHDLTI